ncbi:hypothetical protein RUND412_006914 [Rhizina undulata]
MPPMSLSDLVLLPHSGFKIPPLGFGVYKSPPEVCKASCLTALKSGYRHIDTAQYYENEAQVGEAVRESGLRREEVFVTTKIWGPQGNVEKTLESLRESVRKIGLGYVDLFLIHTPSSGKEGRKEMWQALEKLKEEGGARSIGVSNFGVRHIEELKEFSKVVPAVNQIELHPWCQQRTVVTYCRKEGIVLEAYAPLVRGQKSEEPALNDIARTHSVTPAQVLLRWSLQHEFIPLPKSDTPERIVENARVFHFELAPEQMMTLDVLDEGAAGAICPYHADCP